MGIPEPVPKEIQALWVAADQDLFWLVEHGIGPGIGALLAAMRADMERSGDLDVD